MANVLQIPSRSIPDLLYQNKVWQPAGSGHTVKLEDMAASHRLNLAKWLKRNATQLHRLNEREMWAALFTMQGEMAQMDLESMIARHDDTPPLQWLRATPLWVRLNQLIRKDFAILHNDDPLEVTF